MYVYKITNVLTNDVYVGKTILNLQERFSQHKHRSISGNTYLYRAMRKYGIDNFCISEIESNVEDLNEREKYWIATINPKYNMTSGGDGGDTSLSDSYQRYMKNRPFLISGENNPFYGKRHSEETKQKIRNKKLGTKLSKETIEKIKKAATGRILSKESLKKRTDKLSHKWKITFPSGIEIEIQNLAAFCRENNLDQRNMSKVAAGIYKSSKKFKCEKIIE